MQTQGGLVINTTPKVVMKMYKKHLLSERVRTLSVQVNRDTSVNKLCIFYIATYSPYSNKMAEVKRLMIEL